MKMKILIKDKSPFGWCERASDFFFEIKKPFIEVEGCVERLVLR